MSVNKLALIRYKTIDECLQNRYRKWTLDDLITAVSEALYEYEGIKSGVSKRTIQLDIQTMRSDKLGYFAPIIVIDKKYYAYEDKHFSITKTTISPAELEKMKEAINILKHFNAFQYFGEMNDVIAKLENNICKKQSKSVNYIQFESNLQLKGIDFLMPLFQAIRDKKVLAITYQSFKAKKPQAKTYYPLLLKEYRNRWFLIAKTANTNLLQTLALDRIIDFEILYNETFKHIQDIDFELYYSEVLGVTRSEKDKAQNVVLQANAYIAPYILTKPLHASQQVLKNDPTEGVIFSIKVVINYELEREILGFGENIKVLAPRLLQKHILKRLQNAVNQYDIKI